MGVVRKMTTPGLQPAAPVTSSLGLGWTEELPRSGLLWEVMVRSKAAFSGTWPQLRPPHGFHPKLISQRTGQRTGLM